MVKIIPAFADGNVVDMTALKKDLHESQNGLCPVTLEPFDISDGEIIYSRAGNRDVFVSKIGLHHLRHIYGDSYINDLIVTSVIPDDETFNGESG